MVDCFIAFGGNKDETLQKIEQSIHTLADKNGIENLQLSRLYKTTAVSDIEQPFYLNAVCRFQCSLPLLKLWETIQIIEKEMGKVPKPKNAPRLIDLDLLFYGSELVYSSNLIVPHPRWHERLFVIAPLADLLDVVALPIPIPIQPLLQSITHPHRETVTAQNYRLPYACSYESCYN